MLFNILPKRHSFPHFFKTECFKEKKNFFCFTLLNFLFTMFLGCNIFSFANKFQVDFRHEYSLLYLVLYSQFIHSFSNLPVTLIKTLNTAHDKVFLGLKKIRGFDMNIISCLFINFSAMSSA